MPDKTVCPICKKTGFVRFETVLTRGQVHRAYYCGSCNHSWEIAEDGTPTAPTDPERPDRSRSKLP
jgi:hypothetical protein